MEDLPLWVIVCVVNRALAMHLYCDFGELA
ncbi:MAG: hypothetical protein QOJ51_2083 [Acidobacteriaceae bacterium]|jgi:hypothetical protein|nr:hypothetical protein [Acidobacteriaceae bacterium]MEA2259258.1 hypothetical protein [Acidobacteriaceae bacterium]